jgi:hypothetical protein
MKDLNKGTRGNLIEMVLHSESVNQKSMDVCEHILKIAPPDSFE